MILSTRALQSDPLRWHTKIPNLRTTCSKQAQDLLSHIRSYATHEHVALSFLMFSFCRMLHSNIGFKTGWGWLPR
uniref:Uncharacterized protein n=1 Tax=Utricularia reniformis TaxID=192314 RepID=A0A1Y0B374_9LAMI|nr:hypothetical protein AEK19_MT1653 [Utricularia reniformis]ART31837.1 hypothetical protein AEK19_MT1653 [Utricularia reniformis]